MIKFILILIITAVAVVYKDTNYVIGTCIGLSYGVGRFSTELDKIW